MTPSELIAGAALGFFLIVAIFAAVTANRCIALDQREELPTRVFWSITKTVWIIGPLFFIAVMAFMLSDAPRGDTGGIMSRNMGVAVLAVGAALGLGLFWASAITLGFIASAIARNLPLRLGVAVIFGALLLTPLMCGASVVAQRMVQRKPTTR